MYDAYFAWSLLGPAVGFLFVVGATPFLIYNFCTHIARRGLIASTIALTLSFLSVISSALSWKQLLTGYIRYDFAFDYRDPFNEFSEIIAVFEALVLLMSVLSLVRRKSRRLAARITVAIVGLPVVAGTVWAGLAWAGVRQVEAEWAAGNEFVRIPAGCFQMGRPENQPGRFRGGEPAHRVCLKAFDLAKFTVTNWEWRRVMVWIAAAPGGTAPARSNAPSFNDPSVFKLSDFTGDRQPVQAVTWNEAQRFVQLMSLFGHGRYRLPSEAEWEYAAQAGTRTSRYWGDNIDEGCAYENIADQSLKRAVPGTSLDHFANCNDGYVPTAPVGSFKPNPWGLYDMLGNVAEWVEDCGGLNYREIPADGTPGSSNPCSSRGVRGAPWFDLRFVSTTARTERFPIYRDNGLGFRVARTTAP